MLRVNAFAPHLPADYRAFKGDDSQVVAALRLDNHKVAHLNALSGGIDIDSLSGVLETHLEKFGILTLGNAAQPVIVFKFATAPPVGAVQIVVGITSHRTSAVAVKLYIFVIIHLSVIFKGTRGTVL